MVSASTNQNDPLDLFQANGINPVAENDQLDLFQRSGINPGSQTQNAMSQTDPLIDQLGAALKHSAGLLGAGTAEGIRGILNTPHNIMNVFGMGQQFPNLVNPSTNYAQRFGIENPNFLDKAVMGTAQFLPYALGGELKAAQLGAEGLSNLGARVGLGGLQGMAFGATQSPDPIQGALTAGTVGAAIPIGASAVAGIPGSIKNFLSQYASPSIAKTIVNDLSTSKNVTNQQAFEMAKDNFDKYQTDEGKKWELAKDMASYVDGKNPANVNSPPLSNPYEFDNSGYKDALSGELDKLKSQSEAQTPYARANKDSIDLLKGYLNSSQHGSYSDAIAHNQALNLDYVNEIEPGKSLPFNTVNFAKSQIKQTLQDNIDQNGLQDTLGNALNDANQATQSKNQIFNEITPSTGQNAGDPQYSYFSGMLKSKTPYNDPSNFVNQYLPNGKSESLGRMQQFSQMIGDEDTAKTIIKKNYFDTDNEVKPQQFLSKYNKLSPDEQSYLFNSDQQNSIRALQNSLQMHPDALKNHTFISLWHSTLPAILGGIAGAAEGREFLGMLGGVLAANAGKQALTKAFSTPGMQEYWRNYLLNPASATPNIGSAFSRNVPQSLIMPAIAGGNP